MKKQMSQRQQRVIRDSAIRPTKNEHGINPSTFSVNEIQAARRELTDRKIALEHRLGSLNASIQHAREGSRLTGNYTALCREQENLRAEIAAIQSKLISTKESLALAKRERASSFEAEFVRTARMMLAEDVIDRIIIATVHRMGESSDVASDVFPVAIRQQERG